MCVTKEWKAKDLTFLFFLFLKLYFVRYPTYKVTLIFVYLVL